MGGTWSYLDITALGRQEIWEDSPEGYPQTQAYRWWNRHDEYEDAASFEHALSSDRLAARLEEHLMRDRPRRRRAGGGAPAAVLTGGGPPACWSRAAG